MGSFLGMIFTIYLSLLILFTFIFGVGAFEEKTCKPPFSKFNYVFPAAAIACWFHEPIEDSNEE